MLGRVAVALTVAVLGAIGIGGCTAALLDRPVIVIDDYPTARVRIYRYGALTCRLEVITASETIQTTATRCLAIPRRAVTP